MKLFRLFQSGPLQKGVSIMKGNLLELREYVLKKI